MYLDEPNTDGQWQQTLLSLESAGSGARQWAESVVGRFQRPRHWVLTSLCCPAIHSSQKSQPAGRRAESGLIKGQAHSHLKAHCLLHCGAQTAALDTAQSTKNSHHQSSVGISRESSPGPYTMVRLMRDWECKGRLPKAGCIWWEQNPRPLSSTAASSRTTWTKCWCHSTEKSTGNFIPRNRSRQPAWITES